MEASSITRRTLVRADVREWAWWQLPIVMRLYVGAVPLAAFVVAVYEATHTTWHAIDLGKFCLLVACGLVSVAATPRTAYLQGSMTRDFITAWVLPVAVLLPPIFALATPIPLLLITQWRISKGVVYRRVFTAAALGLAYSAASELFRAFPVSFAGGAIGTGIHAVTWVLAVAACEIVGGRGHRLLILSAIKLADPTSRIRDEALSSDALQADFTEFNLGVLVTIIVGVAPVFAVLVVPMWLLVRRYMVHPHLLAQARIDTKTGLLNAATWEREATGEVDRAVRTNAPLAIALVDIDHFKMVNDTYGHLVGDRVIRAVTDALRGQLRAYDLAGRFGGEEFIILLPQAKEADALTVAERLRQYVASLRIPIDDQPDCMTFVQLTISVGVAALDGANRELTDLMAAADAALYYAKETGRNKTHVITAQAS
jgi:diguanylate cyclase (GGDEF)-like protein